MEQSLIITKRQNLEQSPKNHSRLLGLPLDISGSRGSGVSLQIAVRQIHTPEHRVVVLDQSFGRLLLRKLRIGNRRRDQTMVEQAVSVRQPFEEGW